MNRASRVFIKSNNNYYKIINKFNVSLIMFTIMSIIINIVIGNKELFFPFLKSLLISFAFVSITTYIFNVLKKEYNFYKIYADNTIISIFIILGLFGININEFILILSSIITIVIKRTIKNINISATLYGILFIEVFRYFNNDLNIISLDIIKLSSYKDIITFGGGITNYLFGINYLCPVLSIVCFIYLFYNKSVKYNLLFSYILTFLTIMFLYGIFSGIGLWFPIYELLTDSILFLSVYTLSDYKITPTISEGNILQGIILGIISSILKLIIPSLSIIITFIIGPLLLTRIIDKFSPKIKYNNKLYIGIIISSIIIMIIISFILYKVF